MQVQSERGHDVIAVDDIALLADKDGAVGIAVQGNPEMRTEFFDGPRLKQRGMDRAATRVDVHAVRLVADDVDLGAQFAQHGRGHLIRCAVRTIDHKFDALKIQIPGQ